MSWTIRLWFLELKAQVMSPCSKARGHHEIPTRWDPSQRWHVLTSCWMNWALSPRVFYISRSHLDVGFQKAREVTGWSNSRSLYYGKSVECLCSGNINKLKLSSDIKENPSDLHGYLLPSLLSNSKVSCWVQGRITVLSGPILQMRREPQDDRRHTKKYKNFLNFTPIFYLNQEFSKKLPHCYRE